MATGKQLKQGQHVWVKHEGVKRYGYIFIEPLTIDGVQEYFSVVLYETPDCRREVVPFHARRVHDASDLTMADIERLTSQHRHISLTAFE